MCWGLGLGLRLILLWLVLVLARLLPGDGGGRGITNRHGRRPRSWLAQRVHAWRHITIWSLWPRREAGRLRAGHARVGRCVSMMAPSRNEGDGSIVLLWSSDSVKPAAEACDLAPRRDGRSRDRDRHLIGGSACFLEAPRT